MHKLPRHIEIVRSSDRTLSSLSLKSCAAIFSLLKEHYQTVGVSTVNNLADLRLLVTKQPDLVFMGMKYVVHDGQKVWISQYLAEHGIAHTGSSKTAIEFEQDKPLAKQRVLDCGLVTARYIVAKNGELPTVSHFPLRFPVFVKPASLGGGSGIDSQSIAHDHAALHAKLIALSAEYTADAIIEEYLPGREFSVAVLDSADGILVMPIEMKPGADENGDKMLSLALKKGELETPVLAVPQGVIRDKLASLSTDVFMALGARDYGRIDIRLDASGEPNFIEANLIPCLIKGSGNFPKACLLNAGIDYDEMILQIVELGLVRSDMDTANTYPKPSEFGKITQYLPS